jgi:hypothetical protein
VLAVRRNFPWNRVPAYICAQRLEEIAVASFQRALFGTVGLLDAPTPSQCVSNFKAFGREVLFYIVGPVPATSTDRYRIRAYSEGATTASGTLEAQGAIDNPSKPPQES